MVESATEIFGDLWCIDLNESSDCLKWNEVKPMGEGPIARYGAANTCFRDKFVIHGGRDKDRT